LQHQAGQVLFSVTPDNKEQALDKIREALAIYVRLPASPTLEVPVFGIGEIYVQQLVANVQHLKGQLMLASAVLQAKDATIQAQQQLINQQQRFSSGEVLPSSMLDTSMRRDVNSKEELLGGLVAFTKYEGKGFEVNLAEMFRRLRSWFAEKD